MAGYTYGVFGFFYRCRLQFEMLFSVMIIYRITTNTMGIIKKFSFSAMVERFGQSFKRFPIAMLLIAFLTGFLIFLNHGGDDAVGGKMMFLLIFYPATGALLAVAISLLTEDFKSKVVRWILPVLVQLVWFAVSAWLAQFDRFSMPQAIAVSATVAAFAFAVFLLCFYRKGMEIPFWNFSVRTLGALLAALAIAGFLTLGLILLVESLKMLFGLDFDYKADVDIVTVCMVLLAPILFMNLIPRGEMKYLTEVTEFSRFAKGVVQYLFVPLLGLYMLTLYAYAIKILLQWSLPIGGVSYLVTGSMVLMVLLIYITYPLQHLEGNRLFKQVTRWLPVVMLPLLALMTIAIGRRLSDYGITVSRLYLLAFNLWCYAVCLWLIFTRNKRIWLIPASFAVILFLISVGPQSIPNITRDLLKKEVKGLLLSSGVNDIPVSGGAYEQWLKTADPKVAAAVDSKLDYLRGDYGFETISDLVGKDAILGKLSSSDDTVVMAESGSYHSDYLIHYVTMPQGYAEMTKVNFAESDLVFDKDDRLTVKISDRVGTDYAFEFDKKDFAARDIDRNSEGQAEPFVVNNGKELLVIDEYHLTSYKDGTCYLSLSGILFTR